MKEFFTGLLSTIRDVFMLLLTIFVVIGVPVVFLLEGRQFMSNIDMVLTFVMVSLWGAWLPDHLKHIGSYSTSLYKRLKGEPNE